MHVAKPVVTRLCVIRHGETDWNVEQRIQGHTDVPLNDIGRAQALAMAFNAGHHRFQAIYSSDLVRALDTARALAMREDQAVTPSAYLRERNFGLFQGLTAAEAALRYPEAYACYRDRDLVYDFVDGESLEAFARRVRDAFDSLVRHHAGQTLAVVSHSGVLDVLYRAATGRALSAPRDFTIPNCALNWFRFDGQAWQLEAWGDRHHLNEVLSEPPE